MDVVAGDPSADRTPGDSGSAGQSRPVAVLRSELLLLSGASLGAAVLHAAFAPVHFEETWSHGLFFAVLAWLQLALAVLLLTRASRRVFLAGLLNLFVIAVWVLSRTKGAPFGPNAWKPEEVGVPDVLSTVFEAITVLGCAALLLRASSGKALRVVRGPAWLLGAAITTTVLVACGTTVALTPRFAAHTHGGAAGAAAGHTHDASGVAAGLTGTTPCEKSGPPASEGQVIDSSGHSHRGPTAQEPIDQATREQLDQQQTIARSVADKYPTVAAAEAAGYSMSTVFVPCIGAHYTNVDLAGRFDPAAPSELLFDGTQPDSKIIGLSYLVWHPGGAPDGFAGPNDHWHQHNANGGLCFAASGIVIGGEDTSVADCTARGGRKAELTDIYMLHDWVVPGWECSWGVFAPECPELGGRIGASAWAT
jgi:hypothetical protein